MTYYLHKYLRILNRTVALNKQALRTPMYAEFRSHFKAPQAARGNTSIYKHWRGFGLRVRLVHQLHECSSTCAYHTCYKNQLTCFDNTVWFNAYPPYIAIRSTSTWLPKITLFYVFYKKIFYLLWSVLLFIDFVLCKYL